MEFGSQYPFRPPVIKFVTPVYHPNIDVDGKICLDVLQMPPSGSYNPAITLESILLSIQLLLGSPNPDDPLRSDVAEEYRYHRERFNEQATKLSGKKVHPAPAAVAANDKPADEKKMDVVENKSATENKIDNKIGDGESSTAKQSRKRKHDGS